MTLGVGVAGGLLPVGKYRFTAFSNSTTSIHDLAGLALDGNADGAERGDYVRVFDVVPSNQPPSFQPGANPSVSDESGPQVIAWAMEVFAGPPSEVGQVLQFIVQSNSNPDLFAIPPSIDASGTLRFTPEFNVSGSAQITVVLKDDGGTANAGIDTSAVVTFTIDVAKARAWHNASKALDVTADGFRVSEDALEVINFLNAFGSQPVPTDGRPAGPYYDTDGNGTVTAGDALDVINFLNAFGADGEGEPINNESVRPLVPDSRLSFHELIALLAADVALQPKRRR